MVDGVDKERGIVQSVVIGIRLEAGVIVVRRHRFCGVGLLAMLMVSVIIRMNRLQSQ